ncbi:probable glutathione S-transferase [Durio zibethinus]|uniref:glutathione transferase n=1 Tax=Durio zibethinus TaxID=66656 RepID=A0A6P5YUD7_DURZI|nr:probable glutathione S-transferase [Durio zibethinus]
MTGPLEQAGPEMGQNLEARTQLDVYTWYSPYVHRVAWVLKLKGIDYEFVEENLKDPNKRSPLLLNCNPVYRKIPVLIHHGKPIVESLFIIEYIDDTWKDNPILPTDPYERAMARFWASFIDERLLEGSKRVLSVKGDQLKMETKQVSDAMEVLEGMLEGKKFFGGEKIGFLDIAFGWIAIWLGAIEEAVGVEFFNRRKLPLLETWKDKFKEFHVVKDSLYPTEKLVRFFTKYRHSQLKLAAKK